MFIFFLFFTHFLLKSLSPSSDLIDIKEQLDSSTDFSIQLKRVDPIHYPSKAQLLQNTYAVVVEGILAIKPVIASGFFGSKYCLTAPLKTSFKFVTDKDPKAFQIDFAPSSLGGWFLFDKNHVRGELKQEAPDGARGDYIHFSEYPAVNPDGSVSILTGLKSIVLNNYEDFRQLTLAIEQGDLTLPDGVQIILGHLDEGNLIVDDMCEVSNPHPLFKQMQNLNQHPEKTIDFLLKKTMSLTDTEQELCTKDALNKIAFFQTHFQSQIPRSYQDIFHLLFIVQAMSLNNPDILDDLLFQEILSPPQMALFEFLLYNCTLKQYQTNDISLNEFKKTLESEAEMHLINPSLLLKMMILIDQVNDPQAIMLNKKTVHALFEYDDATQYKIISLMENLGKKWQTVHSFVEGQLFQNAEYGFLDKLILWPKGYPPSNPTLPSCYKNQLIISKEELENNDDLKEYRQYLKNLVEELNFLYFFGYSYNFNSSFMRKRIYSNNILDPISGKRLFFIPSGYRMQQWIVDQERRGHFRGTCVNVTDYLPPQLIPVSGVDIYMLSDENVSEHLKQEIIQKNLILGQVPDQDQPWLFENSEKIQNRMLLLQVKMLINRKNNTPLQDALFKNTNLHNSLFKYLSKRDSFLSNERGLFKQYMNTLSSEEKLKWMTSYQARNENTTDTNNPESLHLLAVLGKDLFD